jgi:hypothetical protein
VWGAGRRRRSGPEAGDRGVLAVVVGVSGDVRLGGWSLEVEACLWSVARALGGRRPVVEARLQSVAQALGDRRLVVMGDGDETGVGGEEKVGFTWLQRGRMKPAQVLVFCLLGSASVRCGLQRCFEIWKRPRGKHRPGVQTSAFAARLQPILFPKNRAQNMSAKTHCPEFIFPPIVPPYPPKSQRNMSGLPLNERKQGNKSKRTLARKLPSL